MFESIAHPLQLSSLMTTVVQGQCNDDDYDDDDDDDDSCEIYAQITVSPRERQDIPSGLSCFLTPPPKTGPKLI